MSAFGKIIPFIFKWEGFVSNDAADPGGLTKYGVSLQFLKGLNADLNGDGVVDEQDVLEVTKDTARDLFRQHFYDIPKLGLIEGNAPCTAMFCCDTAVNTGAGRMARIIQEAVNTLSESPAVKVDGDMGPRTRDAINALGNQGMDKMLALKGCDIREEFYINLAAAKPQMQVFKKGWLNRVNDLRKFIQEA